MTQKPGMAVCRYALMGRYNLKETVGEISLWEPMILQNMGRDNKGQIKIQPSKASSIITH